MSRFVSFALLLALYSVAASPSAAEEPGYLSPFRIDFGKPLQNEEFVIRTEENERYTKVWLSRVPINFGLLKEPCGDTLVSTYDKKPITGFACETFVLKTKTTGNVYAVYFRVKGVSEDLFAYMLEMKRHMLNKYPDLYCNYPENGDHEYPTNIDKETCLFEVAFEKYRARHYGLDPDKGETIQHVMLNSRTRPKFEFHMSVRKDEIIQFEVLDTAFYESPTAKAAEKDLNAF